MSTSTLEASSTVQTSSLEKKPSRKELGAEANLCEYCTAKCCRYFALPIDTPTTRKDYDYIRWYLLHRGASVFTDEEDWYLLVHTECKHLQADQRCGIYETRPQICRAYSTENCEYEDTWTYERYFETPEQVEEYVEAVLMPKPGTSIRSPKKKPRLAVVA
jgi:Fe-S-cluster containining protein